MRWAAGEWHSFLAEAESATDMAALRCFTHTGRPLGSPEFVAGLETSMLRPLAPRKRGCPNKAAAHLSPIFSRFSLSLAKTCLSERRGGILLLLAACTTLARGA